MVIVILGILAAVSLPKFQDLSGDADFASAIQYSAALSTAAQQNISLKAMKNPAAISFTTNGTICNIGMANQLLGAPLPTGYTILSGYDMCGTGVLPASCIVRTPTGAASLYNVPCTK